MRILYVTAHYPPDFVSGATLQVQRLAERAAAAGHDVAVFSGAINAELADGATKDDDLNGVAVRWIGTAVRIEQDDDRNWQNPVATSAVATIIDEFAPDVVHAHTLQTLGAGVVDVALDRDLRVVLTMHDFWWWCPRLFLVDRAMRPCEGVAAASECACAKSAAWRRSRAEQLGRTLDRVDEVLVPSASMRRLVVASGFDPRRVTVDENDVPIADLPTARSSATSDAVRFGYVGGDHPVKGVDVMLDATRRLRRQRDWVLTTYGVAARRLSRRVKIDFEPAYEPHEAGAILSRLDVLLIPSIARESYSIAAREALAAGVAVITSDCVGPEEVVRDGHNGLVVPTGDGAALADAMRRLIDDRPLLARLKDEAVKSAPSIRSPDDHIAALLERYATRPA